MLLAVLAVGALGGGCGDDTAYFTGGPPYDMRVNIYDLSHPHDMAAHGD